LALGANMHIAGAHGASNGSGRRSTRAVEAADFFTGFFATDLAEDEILLAVDVPAEEDGTGSAYAKLVNPASRYAMLGAAVMLTVAGGICTQASVAVGSLVPSAMKSPSVEAALVGQRLSDAVIDAAAAAVDNDLDDQVLGDIHASAEYRRSVAPLFVGRAIRDAVKRAG
jgi:carbon-monoxide dehydrogenase medium subunit